MRENQLCNNGLVVAITKKGIPAPTHSVVRTKAIGCALASPASAQLLNEKSLSATMALTIAQTALETCTKQGYHVSVHVEPIGREIGDGDS